MYSRSKRKMTDIRFLSCNNVQKVVRKVVLTCFSHYSGNKNNYMPLTFQREREQRKNPSPCTVCMIYLWILCIRWWWQAQVINLCEKYWVFFGFFFEKYCLRTQSYLNVRRDLCCWARFYYLWSLSASFSITTLQTEMTTSNLLYTPRWQFVKM